MAYLSLRTAAGHILMVEPRKQRTMFRDLQDALLAEARLNQRQLSYQTYRTKRGILTNEADDITIRSSVRAQLDRLDIAMFKELDAGILAIAQKPRRAVSKPRYYRWFRADFRRMIVGNTPVVYIVGDEDGLEIMFLGLRRWSGVKPASVQIARLKSSK